MKGNYKVKFSFLSVNFEYEQCIILSLDNFKGDIYWDGKKYDKPKRKFATFDLTESEYGKEIELDIDLKEGEIDIFNGCIMKFGDKKLVRYCNGGCAMKIKKFL